MREKEVGRRELLRRSLLSAGGLAIGHSAIGCGAEAEPALASDAQCTTHGSTETGVCARFQHGVASGDPLPDAVILWTRVTPPAGAERVDVAWQIAADPEFAAIVGSGTLATGPERDFTVKVDARGLEPGRSYYYRFDGLGESSPVGRTRTAPVGAVERLRFGVVTCSSFGHGFFHAYAALAARLDLDAVIHLGDYLYEYAYGEWGVVRAYEPVHEAVTLADYRTRHAHYKRDSDLQEVHRQHAFIVLWDDHESANNAWLDGAQNHMPNEGAWADRKAASIRAYHEWMPIREQDSGRRIWRKLAFGDLMDLVMLDTRQWGRSGYNADFAGPAPAPDPDRQLLGADQEQWLAQQLEQSRARWKVIGQQVMVAEQVGEPGVYINLDQWHGYPEARLRLLDLLRRQPQGDVVVVTGDVHNAWACELADDPIAHRGGAGSVAVEFVTPSVTSPGGIMVPPELNPQLRWTDTWRHGYIVLDVTAERVQSAFCLLDSVEQPQRPAETRVAWAVEWGSRVLVQDAEPAASKSGAPAAAPG
jgi:alkaline phosphatase D